MENDSLNYRYLAFVASTGNFFIGWHEKYPPFIHSCLENIGHEPVFV